MPITNPHPVIDWGIATGRLPLDSRKLLVEWWARDAPSMLGYVLGQRPTLPDRPCPIVEAEQVTDRQRRARQRTAERIKAHRESGSGRRIREVAS